MIVNEYIIKDIPLDQITYRWDYKFLPQTNKVVWADWHRDAEELLWAAFYHTNHIDPTKKWWRKLETMLEMMRSITEEGMVNPLIVKLSCYKDDYQNSIDNFVTNSNFIEMCTLHEQEKEHGGYYSVIGNQRLACAKAIHREQPELFSVIKCVIAKDRDNWKDTTESKQIIGYQNVMRNGKIIN